MKRKLKYANCLECKSYRIIHSRLLCKKCYINLDIRAKYPRLVKIHNTLYQQLLAEVPVEPDCPTHTPAGSEERIEVYSRRYSMNQQIFHPQDGIIDLERY